MIGKLKTSEKGIDRDDEALMMWWKIDELVDAVNALSAPKHCGCEKSIALTEKTHKEKHTLKRYECNNCGNGKPLFWVKKLSDMAFQNMPYTHLKTEVRSESGICRQCGSVMDEVRE